MDRLEVRLDGRGAQRVARGRPWIELGDLDEASARRLDGGAPGALVRVVGAGVDRVGLTDPGGPAVVRLLAGSGDARPDAAHFAALLRAARARREAFIDLDRTDAFRLANAEGDDLPGVAVDRYGPFVVLTITSGCLAPHFSELVAAVEASEAPAGVIVRERLGGGADAPARSVAGEAPPASLIVREDGMAILVELLDGNQTGLFCDQRETRARLGPRSRGARVANLFCYTGAFTVRALLDGAAETTSVDTARPALERLRGNLVANDLPTEPPAARSVRADAFDWLSLAAKKELVFDVVILDPPTFARAPQGKGGKKGGRRGKPVRIDERWGELAAGAARILAPGGTLVCSSNSARQPVEALLAAVFDGAKSVGRTLVLEHVGGAGRDFPLPEELPELDTLKVIVARADHGGSR